MALDSTAHQEVTDAILDKHTSDPPAQPWTTFQEYRALIDQTMIDTVGIGIDEFADSNIIWECYESNTPPAQAAAEFFAGDDLATMFFEESEVLNMFEI